MDGSTTTGHEERAVEGRRMVVLGYGFIGRRAALAASRAGWRVVALTHRPPAEAPAPEHDVVIGDVRERDALDAVLDGADHVVLTAGTTKPAESQDHPMHEIASNLGPLITALEAVRAHGTRSMTYLSSAGTVYGPAAPVPTDEDAPLWPISPYGVLKVAAERYVNLYAQQHRFAADVLRCSNVYGPGEPTQGSQGLIGVTRATFQRGEPVMLYGDGSARRDFVHVDDVADVIVRLAARPDAVRVLNVGSGASDSILEVVELVAESLGMAPRIDWRPARAGDVPLVQLDLGRLRAALPFEPRSLRAGLLAGVAPV